MSETSARPLIAVCPHCRKTYSVRPEQLGTSTRCRQCQKDFTVERHQAAPARASSDPPASTAKLPGEGAALLCPICQAPAAGSDAVMQCPTCRTIHHTECWEYNHGCGLYGCKQAPETEKLRDVEIPASYWGISEKTCPRCRKVIQAAAVRCRFCGTTFEARPQDAEEFAQQARDMQSLTAHRRFGIVLLIAAIIPCTAPLAMVVGLVWFLIARHKIAALPALHATVCRLAVGISIAVTVILVALAMLHTAFH